MLISILTRTISHGSNDWLVDSGASKHMNGYKESLVNMSEYDSPHKVKLGDDYQYPIKEIGEASYKLDSRKSFKMKDVISVPGLKKKLLSIYALDAKGIRVSFVDGHVLMFPKGNTIDDATMIGEEDDGLYKLKGHPKQALAHESIEPSELWHRSLAHVNYKALTIARKEFLGNP